MRNFFEMATCPVCDDTHDTAVRHTCRSMEDLVTAMLNDPRLSQPIQRRRRRLTLWA